MYVGLNVGYTVLPPATDAVYNVDGGAPEKNVDSGYGAPGVISSGGGVAFSRHITAEPLTNEISYVNSANCSVVNVLASVKLPCVTVTLLP